MKAAALHDHGDALERAAHELTLVPRRPGLGEARNCGLRNADCGLDRVGYRPKTGAQDDPHARAKAAEPRGNGVRGAADQFRRWVIHSAIRNPKSAITATSPPALPTGSSRASPRSWRGTRAMIAGTLANFLSATLA